MNCRIFHEFSVRAPESRFERRLHTHVKANFVFRLFNVSLSFRAQSVVYVLIYRLSRFGGYRTNSL